MIGFPNELYTKQDVLNALEYMKTTGKGKNKFLAQLERMKATTTRMDLKESAKNKRADKQQQEDYIPVLDVNCRMLSMGFTEEELDYLIGGIINVRIDKGNKLH